MILSDFFVFVGCFFEFAECFFEFGECFLSLPGVLTVVGRF